MFTLSPCTGAPTIPGGIQFNRAALTLTCVSNGGPASEVMWTRDGAAVSTGYTLTQTVTNTTTATYENVLTATTIADLTGTFTCTVSNSRGTAEIILNGEFYNDYCMCIYIYMYRSSDPW